MAQGFSFREAAHMPVDEAMAWLECAGEMSGGKEKKTYRVKRK
ncbi:MAG: hypothetical protein WC421_02780 [Elusimicrobiales bacterium]